MRPSERISIGGMLNGVRLLAMMLMADGYLCELI